jgi:hypothetical protein
MMGLFYGEHDGQDELLDTIATLTRRLELAEELAGAVSDAQIDDQFSRREVDNALKVYRESGGEE